MSLFQHSPPIRVEPETLEIHRNGFALMDFPGENAFLGRVVAEQVNTFSLGLGFFVELSSPV